MAVIAPEVSSLAQRLLILFHPEELVLFGSQAADTARPDSDADFLVVLGPTGEPRESREARVLPLNMGRGMRVHVLPLTVPEIRDALAHGNTAVRDALATGIRVSADGRRSRHAALAGEWSRMAAAAEWLERAQGDLTVAAAILPTKQYWAVAFHAQQAIEKALQALIYHLGGEPARTHDLTELMLEVARLDAQVGRRLLLRHQGAAAEITKHAVQARYPNEKTIDEAGARTAVDVARAVVGDVAELLASAPAGGTSPE